MLITDVAKLCLLTVPVGLCFGGCDGQDRSATTGNYSVEGKVIFEEGQPVAGVLVSFSSLDGTANASAMTDDVGQYHIKTENGRGLPAGDYRVVVGPPADDSEPPPTVAVDPKYANKKTSGLTTTIKPLANYYDIEVERASL